MSESYGIDHPSDQSSCDQHPLVQEHLEQFHRTSSGADVTTMTVLLTLVALFGFIGNALVIAVCNRFSSGLPSAQHFILVIAICDFVVCLAFIPYRITSYHVIMPEVLCKCFEGMTYFTVMYSLTLLIAVAFDRFFAVCHPLTFQRISNMSRSATMLVCLLCLVISWPAGLIAGQYINVKDNVTNVTTHCYTGICNEDGQDTRFMSDAGIFIYIVFLGVLYCTFVVLVIILYSSVFFSIYKRFSQIKVSPSVTSRTSKTSRTARDSHSKPEVSVIGQSSANQSCDTYHSNQVVVMQQTSRSRLQGHRRAAKILLMVTVVFIIAWVPFLLMKTRVVPNVVTIRLSFFASNMINPVIYSFSNKQFRINVKKLLGLKNKPSKAETA